MQEVKAAIALNETQLKEAIEKSELKDGGIYLFSFPANTPDVFVERMISCLQARLDGRNILVIAIPDTLKVLELANSFEEERVVGIIKSTIHEGAWRKPCDNSNTNGRTYAVNEHGSRGRVWCA